MPSAQEYGHSAFQRHLRSFMCYRVYKTPMWNNHAMTTERILSPIVHHQCTFGCKLSQVIRQKTKGDDRQTLPRHNTLRLKMGIHYRYQSEWVSRGLTSHSTLYRSFRGRFLQARWPNQQHPSTALRKPVGHWDRLQSHQNHSTVLQYKL